MAKMHAIHASRQNVIGIDSPSIQFNLADCVAGKIILLQKIKLRS